SVMGSNHIRADYNLAYPIAEISVRGPEGAVNILYRRELAKATDAEAFRAERVKEFKDKFANPYVAAEKGYTDEGSEQKETRPKLIRALKILANKRDTNPPKNHGTIPL